ncbi:MAG: MATE family efflux transporter [Oscillospiraceae bacterium]|nr:MATE family efflux transporter [Oscillospiraceae bacterium]
MKAAKTEIFEKAPIKRAVLSQIIPAIASQMVILLYNLADTYFVGMLNDPVQTASVTIAFPLFMMLPSLSNLFGVGGSTAIARALGRKDSKSATDVSSVAFWTAVIFSLLYSAVVLCFMPSLLTVCGAKSETLEHAMEYAKWTVVIGGPFAVLNTVLANLVRSEGRARVASIGISCGGILNIILDPFFVLPQFLGFKAAGAGMATAISNAVVTVFFVSYIIRNRDTSILSLNPSYMRHFREHFGSIFVIGFPSALQFALTVVAETAQARFLADYRITEVVAAYGIVKKLDQLPLFFSLGVSGGLLPMLAFNHSAGNIERRKKAFRLGVMISVGFSLICLTVYEIFAPTLVGFFIENDATVSYGAAFLRLMVTAMPLMSICYPLIIQFQAMGRAKESLICSLLRKGVLDIPLLFLLNTVWPLYGCLFVQFIVDGISLIVESLIYRKIRKEERLLSHA